MSEDCPICGNEWGVEFEFNKFFYPEKLTRLPNENRESYLKSERRFSQGFQLEFNFFFYGYAPYTKFKTRVIGLTGDDLVCGSIATLASSLVCED